MLQIQIQDMDEIHMSVLELEIITYLRCLVQNDRNGDGVFDEFMSKVDDCAEGYLLEQEVEILQRLQRVLHKKAFLMRSHEEVAEGHLRR